MDLPQKIKKILTNSLLPVFAGVILVAGIIYAWNEPSGAPPTGSGAMSISQGNIGIGTSTPTAAKGTGGYLDVKDVFLRDANRWASDSGSCVCRLGSGLQVAMNCGSGWSNIYSSGGSPIAYFRCSSAVTQFGNYLVNGTHTETDCTSAAVLTSSDPQTKLLIHADEANGSASLADSSISNSAITASGNAKTSNSNTKFSNNVNFPGGASDYLSVPDSSNLTWDGDFTIDLWLRPTVINGNYEAIMGTYNDAANGFILTTSYGANSHIAWWTSSTTWYDTGQSLTLNTWQHLAVVRSGSTIKIYKNGSQIGPDIADSSSINSGTGKLYIGKWASGYAVFSGSMDEIRISKGIARWTANFTPPASPYSVTVTPVNGIVQTDGSGNKFCKLQTDSCLSLPGGWSQYNNWSQTQAATCAGVAGGSPSCPAVPPASQSTGSHTFSNAAVFQESFLYSDGNRVPASSNDYTTPYSDSGNASWWCSYSGYGGSLVCSGGNDWYGTCYDQSWNEAYYACRVSVASYCNTVNQRTCSASIQAAGCW